MVVKRPANAASLVTTTRSRTQTELHYCMARDEPKQYKSNTIPGEITVQDSRRVTALIRRSITNKLLRSGTRIYTQIANGQTTSSSPDLAHGANMVQTNNNQRRTLSLRKGRENFGCGVCPPRQVATRRVCSCSSLNHAHCEAPALRPFPGALLLVYGRFLYTPGHSAKLCRTRKHGSGTQNRKKRHQVSSTKYFFAPTVHTKYSKKIPCFTAVTFWNNFPATVK